MGTTETTRIAIDRILVDLVELTDGVRGAVVGSADGHPISSHLRDVAVDAATVAAMAAAMHGLSTQLVRLGTDTTTTANTHSRGDGGQVWVLDVGRSATLTVFGTEDGEARVIAGAANTTTQRLVALLTTAANG